MLDEPYAPLLQSTFNSRPRSQLDIAVRTDNLDNVALIQNHSCLKQRESKVQNMLKLAGEHKVY